MEPKTEQISLPRKTLKPRKGGRTEICNANTLDQQEEKANVAPDKTSGATREN